MSLTKEEDSLNYCVDTPLEDRDRAAKAGIDTLSLLGVEAGDVLLLLLKNKKPDLCSSSDK
jgi:hypothetical protein